MGWPNFGGCYLGVRCVPRSCSSYLVTSSLISSLHSFLLLSLGEGLSKSLGKLYSAQTTLGWAVMGRRETVWTLRPSSSLWGKGRYTVISPEVLHKDSQKAYFQDWMES